MKIAWGWQGGGEEGGTGRLREWECAIEGFMIKNQKRTHGLFAKGTTCMAKETYSCKTPIHMAKDTITH